MIAGTDTFTTVLRYVVWIGAGLFVLSIFGAITATAFMKWWRQYQLKWHQRIYDWEVDGGPDADFIEDMYPRTHVHLPDEVPKEWVQEWT